MMAKVKKWGKEIIGSSVASGLVIRGTLSCGPTIDAGEPVLNR